MDRSFLTVKEMSLKLGGVSEKTIYRMVSAKTIPFAIKIGGGQWRFNSDKIENWMIERDGNEDVRCQTNLKIKVAEAVSNGLVLYRAHGETRDEILDEVFAMCNAFPADEVSISRNRFSIKNRLSRLLFRGDGIDDARANCGLYGEKVTGHPCFSG